MKSISQSSAERWFKIVVLLGAVANFLLAIGGLLVPNLVLSVFNIPSAYPDIWVRFSCLLLILLTLFYLPGAFDPHAYSMNATLMIISRSAGVLFFPAMVIVFKYTPAFLVFGLYDFIWGFPAALLLYRLRSGDGDGGAEAERGEDE